MGVGKFRRGLLSIWDITLKNIFRKHTSLESILEPHQMIQTQNNMGGLSQAIKCSRMLFLVIHIHIFGDILCVPENAVS